MKRAHTGRDKPRAKRERDERSAAALRENLRKRRLQARARPDGETTPKDDRPGR